MVRLRPPCGHGASPIEYRASADRRDGDDRRLALWRPRRIQLRGRDLAEQRVDHLLRIGRQAGRRHLHVDLGLLRCYVNEIPFQPCAAAVAARLLLRCGHLSCAGTHEDGQVQNGRSAAQFYPRQREYLVVFDLFLYPDTGRIIVRGEERIKVYQDVLPLTMDDLRIPIEGLYQSSRLTERNGILMKSLYASEQSFNSPESTENLSLISYSVYRSDWKAALDWVESKKGFQNLPVNEDLRIRWNSDSVRTDGVHRVSVRYPDKLLVFLTSAEISEIDLSVVLDKFLLNQ